MPNHRGSVGRGQGFGRANLTDPAGGEFDDIVAGVACCAARGLADPGRVGASYGGYLTAWALSRPEVFRCGVVIAGVTDLLSCRSTANNAPFYDFLLGGPPHASRPHYYDRSPVTVVGAGSVPALILHGEDDSCMPVSRAHELYGALAGAGVTAELVVYPREGHQAKEPDHLADQRQRVVSWFGTHLRQP